jgi:fumarylpyruvate hydrolase
VTYIFTPPPIPAVPVSGNDAQFAVNRIYCVGQNYSDHVKEMGGDPKKNPPIFFSKPANAIVTDNKPVNYPQATSELHHEVELVVAMASGGRAIPVSEALNHVYGYAVGVDFTRRDLQLQAKQGGKPWDVAKGFDQSAPVSAIQSLGQGSHSDQGAIQLAVNGKLRQQGDLSQMIWSVAEIIAALSNLFELKTGDLIFTGTPAGVSAVNAGDRIEASIENVGELAFELLGEQQG